MSRRLVFLALLPIAFGSTGCSLVKGAMKGESAASLAAKAKKIADGMAEAAEMAKKDCEPLDKSIVAYPEELAIGGAIAIGLAQKNGHFSIDGMTEKEPGPLKAKVDSGTKLTFPASDKNAMAAYVATVGKNIANASARPDIKWTFGVIESTNVNAFSAPGGYVVVTTGLLKLIDNEAELAAALSHEVGHVTNRHAIKAYMGAKHQLCVGAMTAKHGKDKLGEDLPAEFGKFLEFADPILLALSGGGAFELDKDSFSGKFVAALTDIFMNILTLGFAKEQEFEADKTALELLFTTGYDTTQFDALLGKLPSGPISTHPPPKDRTAALEALRTGDYAGFANGKVKGENPPALKIVKGDKPAS